jgi:hypothetical protein
VVDMLALTPGLPPGGLWRHDGAHLLIAWSLLCALTAFVVVAAWVLNRRLRADTR